ncbi:MAG: hypothetical protein KDA36_00525, partial [Planctomycetaceae bacterium]|nr:hypothetical protein [Planctomycetaceae bacterium]
MKKLPESAPLAGRLRSQEGQSRARTRTGNTAPANETPRESSRHPVAVETDDFEEGLDLGPQKPAEPPMPDLDEEEQAAYAATSRYDEIKRGEIHIAELQRMTM